MRRNERLVLMVDDDEDDVLLVQDAVTEAELTLSLKSVWNGEELMDYLYQRAKFTEAQRPDLIFLDLNMPKKDGWQTLAEIKANPDFKHIPVIVFTTTNNPIQIRRVYKLGAASFVIKPASFSKMIDLLKTIYQYWFETVELTGTPTKG